MPHDTRLTPQVQHNYSAKGQNVNHGEDQNINSGSGQFYTCPQPLKSTRSTADHSTNENANASRNGTGVQHNYSAEGQNINHGEDQNVNSGSGRFYTNFQPPLVSSRNEMFNKLIIPSWPDSSEGQRLASLTAVDWTECSYHGFRLTFASLITLYLLSTLV
ncbi:hypothetical protein E1B28_003398 [Marasmius oreades]|uniref:Uncharacterized protein n=1 Tax=Marasmius oreades TaxID=181124 RepID=A0A9P7UKR4_9AGAR|nr:uncharacterized protein E1B28_003398 [Marasmius oreades]KAG7085865.1 hypothetical protein E1B28_003398 [Marasmius oreades]